MSSEPLRTAELIRFGENFELDLRAYELRRGGRSLKLEPIPMALLVLLIEHKGVLVTRDQIVERVWDQHFDGGTNVVNVYINYLRSKIDVPGQLSLIRTVRGLGFALVPPEGK